MRLPPWPRRAPACRGRRGGAAGFTLVELVFVVALLGVLSAYATLRLATPATLTLPAQAHALADLVRRAQTLSMARGQRMGVSVEATGANGRVAIACAGGAMPCASDASFSASQGVSVGLAPGTPSTLYFNTLGQPVDAAGMPLGGDAGITLGFAGAGTYTVTVSALTGRVALSARL